MMEREGGASSRNGDITCATMQYEAQTVRAEPLIFEVFKFDIPNICVLR